MENEYSEKHFNLSDAEKWLKSENPKERLLGSKLLERLTDGSIFLLSEIPSDHALVALENIIPFILQTIEDLSQKLYFKSDTKKTFFEIEEQILLLLIRALGNCLVKDYLQSEAALRNWIPNCLRVLRGTSNLNLRANCLRTLVNFSTRSLQQRRDIIASLKLELQDIKSIKLNTMGRTYLKLLVFQV